MARRPSPWYWEARHCWYVQFNKKQHKLDPDKDTAWKLYGRMLAAGNAMNETEIEALTVPEVIDFFLDKSNDRQESTRQTYVYVLSPIAGTMVGKPISKLTKQDVMSYLDSRPTWKDGYKHLTYSILRAFTKWCRDKGYLSIDPLATSRNPFHQVSRDSVLTREQLDKIVAVSAPGFGLLVRVMWATGCRPGEACKLQVRHIHATEPTALLSAREHKTGHKTGKARTIIFPEELMCEVRRAVDGKAPEDFVITNKAGTAWNPKTVYKRFKAAAKKAGLPDNLVPYSARHSFVTEGILSGENTAMIAKAMGHTGDQTIQAHYLHATNKAISEIVERRSKPATKSTKQEMIDEMRALSARLSELTAKVLEGDVGPGSSGPTGVDKGKDV